MEALAKEVQGRLVELAGDGVALLPGIVFALIVLALTRTAANLVRRVVRKISIKTLKSLSLQSLLTQTSFAATWVLGILFACTLAFQDLGFADIIGLLGLGSVAIGFAFQDIFKNFLAGILLLLQEPFSLGDQIVVGEYEGTVEEIALRCIATLETPITSGELDHVTSIAIGIAINKNSLRFGIHSVAHRELLPFHGSYLFGCRAVVCIKAKQRSA